MATLIGAAPLRNPFDRIARRAAGAALVALLVGWAAPLDAGEPVNLDAIAGVYKHTFTNHSAVDGSAFKSEDILEIVKVSPTTAYIRTHLEFFNAHICDLSGIADVRGDQLVYDRMSGDDDQRCLFTITVSGDKLTFADPDGICRSSTCGARGGYDDEGFPRKERRPIGYLAKLLASKEYQAAMHEHDTIAPSE